MDALITWAIENDYLKEDTYGQLWLTAQAAPLALAASLALIALAGLVEGTVPLWAR